MSDLPNETPGADLSQYNSELDGAATAAVDAAKRELAAAEAEYAAAMKNAPPPVCRCGAGPHPTVPNRCAAGHAIAGNVFARKYMADESRRAQLLAQFVRHYQPDTQRLRSMCEQLAAVTEQLEGSKADGRIEHQRLVQLSHLLGATLEESRKARLVAPDSDVITDETTDEELIARATSVLRALLQSKTPMSTVAESDEDHVGASISSAPVERPAPAPRALETAVEGSERGVETPALPAECPYCLRPCVGRGHISFDVLHWDDPIEVARRRDAATAQMMARVGRPHPWL